jgi:hypothetical protein
VWWLQKSPKCNAIGSFDCSAFDCIHAPKRPSKVAPLAQWLCLPQLCRYYRDEQQDLEPESAAARPQHDPQELLRQAEEQAAEAEVGPQGFAAACKHARASNQANQPSPSCSMRPKNRPMQSVQHQNATCDLQVTAEHENQVTCSWSAAGPASTSDKQLGHDPMLMPLLRYACKPAVHHRVLDVMTTGPVDG